MHLILYLKKAIVLVLLFLFSTTANAEYKYKSHSYKTFISSEMFKWEGIIKSIEDSSHLKTIEQKLELISYYYGYTGHLIGKKKFEKATKFCTIGEHFTDQLLRIAPKNSTANSYKGAFIGFRIAINKLKNMKLYDDSKAFIDKALELDPNNTQAIIDKANYLFYMPSMIGGDKQEALHLYIKGARLMEKNKDAHQNWFYLNTLTLIAMAYDKTDQDHLAKIMYEKILHLEPNYRWVKQDLYPKLLLKLEK